jgi:hypothetical protein
MSRLERTLGTAFGHDGMPLDAISPCLLHAASST